MPFDPLPESLSELCRPPFAADFRAVELGCGDGRLLGLLRRKGLPCTGLDRLPRAAGSMADVVGDACRPPFLPGSIDLLVAGNFVRHLLPRRPDGAFLREWLGLLRPGGSLFVLEDEPGGGAAAANYRDLQAFLARLDPLGRGPLVSADAFRQALPPDLAATVRDGGVMDNRWPLDAAAVMTMLASGRPAPGRTAARLLAAIGANGVAYGRQWWCRLANPSGSELR
jgi:SAM-dependent methyltransferase